MQRFDGGKIQIIVRDVWREEAVIASEKSLEKTTGRETREAFERITRKRGLAEEEKREIWRQRFAWIYGPEGSI